MILSDPKHVNPAIGIAERKIDLAVQSLREAKSATKVRIPFMLRRTYIFLVPEIWVG